jgi:hypothetical protein
MSELETVSKDISLGGLLVRSASHVPTGTSVTFELSVHGRQSVRPVHLIGDGMVVRTEKVPADGTYVMAVKCRAPISELQDILRM